MRHSAEMDPIPLPDAVGAVVAYRCGRCQTVQDGSLPSQASRPRSPSRSGAGAAGPSATQLKRARRGAEQCCRCSACGQPLEEGRRSGVCAACGAQQRAQLEASRTAALSQSAAREAALVGSAHDVAAARQLEAFMSDLSEEAYCAGWYDGMEHMLWRYVLDGPAPPPARPGFGFESAVRQEQVDKLRRLSTRAGGWWVWSEELGGTLFVPLAQWQAQYVAPSRGR